MKYLRKTLIATLLTFGLLSVSHAQSGDTAIGLRFGGTSGLTYKHYTPNKAFEGILGFWGNGFSATALFETHPQAFDTPGLHWYYGAGAHVAFFNNNAPRNNFGRGERLYNDNEMAFGIDGVLGLEYKAREIPFIFSFGIKPFIEIDTDGRFYGAPDPGFGIKYVF